MRTTPLATGTLEPARTTNVGTQVSGTIQTLDADFNSTVRAGQVVARIDPSIYDALLDQAKAEIGLSDPQWTELVSGSLHPGDELVTGAAVRGRRQP